MRWLPTSVTASARRLALAVVLAWSIAACVNAPPPMPPDGNHRVDLVVATPVAGGFVELLRPNGAVVQAVVPLRPETLVRGHADGDRVRVAWVGGSAVAGEQVRIEFVPGSSTGGLPEALGGQLLADPEGVDLGIGPLSVVAASASTPSGVPLTVSPFDLVAAGGMPLLPAFADHPLGDLDGNGALEIRDALWLLARTRDLAWSPFQLYHSDLDADDVTTFADLRRLLDKLVDPGLPARLHVKPRELSFAQLAGTEGPEAILLVANQGRVPLDSVVWEQLDPRRAAGVSRSLVGGIAGQSEAWRLTLPGTARRGWLPGFWRLRLGSGQGEAMLRLGHLVVLVAGQSNAVGVGSPLGGWPELPRPGVRMLGNDYVWRNATEPLDDPSGQLDLVSRDTDPLYSIGTQLGNLLESRTGFVTYLIPAAKGGTSVSQWLPPADRLDRTTLFGSANFRGQVSTGWQANPVPAQPLGSEGGPVSVLVWYQGESDNSSTSNREAFRDRTHAAMDAFVAELGVPIVYVQLASQYAERQNLQQHAIAELQRQMETGYGVPGHTRPGFHMVAAYDLPRSDRIHLSAFGMRVLAERIDLAIREHVLGEAVYGTGPRLADLRWSGLEVVIETTRSLAAGPLDTAYFTVFDGPPSGSVDDPESYGGNAIEIVSAARDPADGRSVRLTLAAPPSETPYVRYMALPEVEPSTSFPSMPEVWEVMAEGIVVGAGSGLPLPVFGPLPATPSP